MDEILIVEYDPQWSAMYEAEKARVVGALGDRVKRIEHIGSTAVPNLPAKPIIDILIGVESIDESREKAVPILEDMGYSFWAADPNKEVLFLVKGLPPNGSRTHHIHIAHIDSPTWERVLFRDYLRAHADEAQRYAQLKRDLAEKFTDDREAYTDAKGEYIKRITALAKEQR
jgi:GrpB-like predicted nucleotidyltransferase (UPF0157 family)